jgi:hypothetical protein
MKHVVEISYPVGFFFSSSSFSFFSLFFTSSLHESALHAFSFRSSFYGGVSMLKIKS